MSKAIKISKGLDVRLLGQAKPEVVETAVGEYAIKPKDFVGLTPKMLVEQGDKVKLMTVHAAKGLEFPYVFLCGMNEGIFPSRKVRTLPGMEEERRLAFVALTRAEKGLYLSEADGWNFDGLPRYPSRFLLDIDRELLSFTHEVDETLLREAADDVTRRDKYLREDDGDGTLPIGQRVRHAVFGEGTVLDVDLNKGAHVIQFDGMGTPRSISLRAKLEKIGP